MRMIISIKAVVPEDYEAQFRKAMEDADFNLMQALDPEWIGVKIDDKG